MTPAEALAELRRHGATPRLGAHGIAWGSLYRVPHELQQWCSVHYVQIRAELRREAKERDARR